MNCKNSDRIEFLVFVLKRGLFGFSLNYVKKSEAFRNENARKCVDDTFCVIDASHPHKCSWQCLHVMCGSIF